MRTHYCGSISESDIDSTVTLYGWVDRRRDHGGVIFLDMRDREGIVQVVFDPDTEAAFALADRVRSEYVLSWFTRPVIVGVDRRASPEGASHRVHV